MLVKVFKKLIYLIRYTFFRFFLLFGKNIYKSRYELIPQATRFMRNIPLLNNIFTLLRSNNKVVKCFFHAGSTGEEVYSFLMFNNKNYKLDLDVVVGEYENSAVKKIQEAKYSKEVIEEINKSYLKDEDLEYFIQKDNYYLLKDNIKNQVRKILLCDYTKMDSKFIETYSSDIVFCNNTLLYHEINVQEKVLENLCLQSKKYLVITGVDNQVLERVLKKYNFYPYQKDWELIYDNWKLRRRRFEPIFPTPTTPYLTDYNKKKEHFFKYSIFIKKKQ